MKVVSNEALTKLIQLVKSAFIKVEDVVEVTEIETETPSEITLATVATTGAYSDLSGTPTVDQTYSASSTNAQSGTAVAEAISDLLADDNTWTGTNTFSDKIRRTAALSGSGDQSVSMIDENGKGYTSNVSYYSSANNLIHRFYAENITASVYAYIDVWVNDDGTVYHRLGTNGTEDFTTNSIVSSNTRTLASKTIKVGFNTGLKIATAEITASAAGDVTFSYGITFSASPVVIVTRRSGASTTTNINTWVRGNTGTSNSKVYFSAAGTAQCIAIGY